jgi:integrase
MSIRQIRVHGRKVWQARVAYRGLRSSRIAPNKDAAKLAESEILQALTRRVGAAESESAGSATLRQLFEAYAEDLVNRGKGEETVQRATQTARVVEAFTPELLDKPLGRISEADIFAFRRARQIQPCLKQQPAAEPKDPPAPLHDPAKPATINRDLRTLRAMLKRVRPDFKFPPGAFFPEDETRVRWLRPEDELLVIASMASPFREMAQLAALTLMRLSEIRLLRREMVRLEQGAILLPRAKAGARLVILSAGAQKLLRVQLERIAGEWVFPDAAGRPYDRNLVSKHFRKAARQAGLRDFRFHDLRHHGATMALNAGYSAPIVMALGGWKTERMMRRYAAVTDRTLRAAAEAVSGAEQPLQGAPVGRVVSA